ncbi:hypothetical protein Tco_1205850 [Tanacetum coccineum]
MTALKFVDSHNMVAYLERPTNSDDFTKIVDFLNANLIGYALTVSPTIYVSCIDQFWSTAKAQIINEETQIHALVISKKIVITESSVRRDLLADEDGTDCLPTTTIFENLKLMSPNKRVATTASSLKAEQGTGSGSGPRCQDTMGDIIAQTRFENVSKTSYDSPLREFNTPRSDEDSMQLKELMEICTNLLQRVQDLENTNIAQAKEITSLKKKGQEARTKRKVKISRVEKGRNIAKIDADEDISLVHEDEGIQGRFDDEDMFDTSVFNDEEVFAGQDMADQEFNVAEKEVSAADLVTTAGEVVTTASVDISTASVPITISTATPTTPPKAI